MKIFDAHCDVLLKMFMDHTINFNDSAKLQVNLEGLNESGVKVQMFAIYVPEAIHPELKFNAALHMIDIFYEKILKPFSKMKLIRTKEDYEQLTEGEIGAILTLEGCDAIHADIMKLKTLIRLGVTSVGLTWNYGNSVADGALEKRGGGLSRFGKEVVNLLNERKVKCDVSHLSEKGFWDVMEWSALPFASHSNCFSLCKHARNLKDEQIKALIEKDSVLGITFVTHFLSMDENVTLSHIINHIDHICELGGENHVGFGSDFDGTDREIKGLESVRYYDHLMNELLKYYSNEQVRKFAFNNFSRMFFR
ncbi:dipeptidase [Cytobacillus purgationiresistens]|uniref:Membrane dipeptidase n=1 Tax=Cytobacillus purgationiresistens TaxID=863449 RepID=A0ABU0AFV9_9BACI|nr:dipeptidase [Cytobacillus purgationiresistens]MDQ0270147.1 membrane dipeptidase [Cytobacillus purgationiresistens]